MFVDYRCAFLLVTFDVAVREAICRPRDPSLSLHHPSHTHTTHHTPTLTNPTHSHTTPHTPTPTQHTHTHTTPTHTHHPSHTPTTDPPTHTHTHTHTHTQTYRVKLPKSTPTCSNLYLLNEREDAYTHTHKLHTTTMVTA